MMQDLELGIPSQQAELDLPQADDVRINDIGPVMRATGNGIELVPMTFSFPPGRQGGAPVFNFRSEGRHFANSNRCLIPASAFFEFTGKRSEGEAPFYVERLAGYGDRRHLEAGGRQSSARIYDADDGARTGHCSLS